MFTFAFAELVSAIVAMRKRSRMNQRELAKALGREQNYIARIETGQRRVDLIELIQICKACGHNPKTEITSLLSQIADHVMVISNEQDKDSDAKRG